MNIVGGVVSIEAAAPTDAAAEEQRGEAADAAAEEEGGEAAGQTAGEPSAVADENSRLRDAGNKVIENLEDYRPTGAEASSADANPSPNANANPNPNPNPNPKPNPTRPTPRRRRWRGKRRSRPRRSSYRRATGAGLHAGRTLRSCSKASPPR